MSKSIFLLNFLALLVCCSTTLSQTRTYLHGEWVTMFGDGPTSYCFIDSVHLIEYPMHIMWKEYTYNLRQLNGESVLILTDVDAPHEKSYALIRPVNEQEFHLQYLEPSEYILRTAQWKQDSGMARTKYFSKAKPESCTSEDFRGRWDTKFFPGIQNIEFLDSLHFRISQYSSERISSGTYRVQFHDNEIYLTLLFFEGKSRKEIVLKIIKINTYQLLGSLAPGVYRKRKYLISKTTPQLLQIIFTRYD